MIENGGEYADGGKGSWNVTYERGDEFTDTVHQLRARPEMCWAQLKYGLEYFCARRG